MSLSKKYWISVDEKIDKDTRTILNEYLLNMKLSNKAETTIVKYKNILELFLSECPIKIADLKSENIFNWLQFYQVGKKPKTIDGVLAALSSFFKFCLSEEYMDQWVLKRRWRPKIPQSLPKYLSEPEYVKVKSVSEQLTLRDRGIILFLFSSGCRRGELVNIKLKDIDLEKRTAQVIGKGNKFRTVHFSIECSIVLKEYFRTRTMDPESPLFLNRWGHPLGRNGIYKLVKKLGVLSELSQSLHPHVCRHTFATHLLARGADLQFIAEEMGHADLNTTRVYARIPSEEMLIAYQNIMG